jgi:predicted Holliday junction resolvase-like endonuclease
MSDPDTLRFWLIVTAIAAAVLFGMYRTARAELVQFQARVQMLAQEQYQRWRQSDISALRQGFEDTANAQAGVNLQAWRIDAEATIRQDAAKRSQAITLGKVTEHLVPYFGSFEFNPKDARFIGSPVDLIVFDGLSDDAVREVVFIEVKTGASKLSLREKMVRQAVLEGRVAWRELRIPSP